MVKVHPEVATNCLHPIPKHRQLDNTVMQNRENGGVNKIKYENNLISNPPSKRTRRARRFYSGEFSFPFKQVPVFSGNFLFGKFGGRLFLEFRYFMDSGYASMRDGAGVSMRFHAKPSSNIGHDRWGAG